jgi:hypothetical protein
MRIFLIHLRSVRALAALLLLAVTGAAHAQLPADHPLFVTSSNCGACHNGLVTPDGEDISIASNWSASMMANSARDPYWQAAVRREMLDHPESGDAIQDECSKCHMPMARFTSNANGHAGSVFANLGAGAADPAMAALAQDGVSCSLCHQILADNLGQASSLVGGFHVDTATPLDQRQVFGPFTIDEGRQEIMRSATGFRPESSAHIQSSELCATCHTLITEALGVNGAHIGTLFEQMPYQEWQHSAYATAGQQQSCQDCHMPPAEQATQISSVLGQAREEVRRHDFRGGNFFIQRVLNRYRDELGVAASGQALEAAATRTEEHLKSGAAGNVRIDALELAAGKLNVDVTVSNASGHKFPTAYPSRRAWVQLEVRDANGNAVFDSGRLLPTGAIVGNDNDADAGRFEPHYDVIDDAEQVQIYESIVAGADGAITTGLLTATQYLKDNRLLPNGFDKATAAGEISVKGDALGDADFAAGQDSVRYTLDTGAAPGPYKVTATLWFQPIGFRWAENLTAYDAPETKRFVGYYRAMADRSALVMSSAEASSTPNP